jgi:hypothetical protein
MLLVRSIVLFSEVYFIAFIFLICLSILIFYFLYSLEYVLFLSALIFHDPAQNQCAINLNNITHVELMRYYDNFKVIFPVFKLGFGDFLLVEGNEKFYFMELKSTAANVGTIPWELSELENNPNKDRIHNSINGTISKISEQLKNVPPDQRGVALYLTGKYGHEEDLKVFAKNIETVNFGKIYILTSEKLIEK